jgi:hypothetical protein
MSARPHIPRPAAAARDIHRQGAAADRDDAAGDEIRIRRPVLVEEEHLVLTLRQVNPLIKQRQRRVTS